MFDTQDISPWDSNSPRPGLGHSKSSGVLAYMLDNPQPDEEHVTVIRDKLVAIVRVDPYANPETKVSKIKEHRRTKSHKMFRRVREHDREQQLKEEQKLKEEYEQALDYADTARASDLANRNARHRQEFMNMRQNHLYTLEHNQSRDRFDSHKLLSASVPETVDAEDPFITPLRIQAFGTRVYKNKPKKTKGIRIKRRKSC